MYANDKDGEFPANLEVLVEKGYLPNGRFLINPRRPKLKVGYVYLKPAGLAEKWGGQAAQTVLMYEAYEEWGEGINVGFADGHVEFIADEERFKRHLKRAKEFEPDE